MQVEVLKSSMQEKGLKKCQLPVPDVFSALGLGAFEKVRVGVGTCACVIHICEYHFLDTINIWNNELLILDKFKFQPTSSCLALVS